MSEQPAAFICESGVAFKWPQYARLQADTDVTVILPGGILACGQVIQDVIDAPNDALIGFDRAADEIGFDTIRVVLKAGQSLAIKRSSMAIASSASNGSIRFWVLDGGV